MVQLSHIVAASGRLLFLTGEIPRRSSYRHGSIDEEPPLGFLGNNHPEDPLPEDEFLRG